MTAVPVGKGDVAYQLFNIAEDQRLIPVNVPEIVANNEFEDTISGFDLDCVVLHDQISELLTDATQAEIILSGNSLANVVGLASQNDSIPDDLSPIYLLNKNRNKGLF